MWGFRYVLIALENSRLHDFLITSYSSVLGFHLPKTVESGFVSILSKSLKRWLSTNLVSKALKD
jgi:hypothetical protein